MKNSACYIGLLVVLVGSQLSAIAHAQRSVAFVPYTCQYKGIDEFAKLLRPLLPETNTDASVQIVVDQDGNRLLLSGPTYVHKIAGKLLAEIDRPAVGFVQEPEPRETRTMQTYRLPGRLHAEFISQLQNRYGNQIRVSQDSESGNVFVTAEENQHGTIGELAAGLTGRLQASVPSTIPVEFRDGSGGQPTRPQDAQSLRAKVHPRFVRVPPAQLDRLQQQIVALFSSRLSVQSIGSRRVYILETGGQPKGLVEVEFDGTRSGVLVGGTGVATNQMVQLIESLVSRSDGRSAKVFRLRRESHPKLRDLLNQGARHVSLHNRISVSRASTNSVRRLPMLSERPNVELARFQSSNAIQRVAQTAAQDDLDGNSGFFDPENGLVAQAVQPIPVVDAQRAEVGPVQQFDGVEVESLPELDVIILRGPDQDLKQLADIIRQLERISRETQPEVRVVPLQHAQSEALSAIIEEVSPDLVGGRQGKVSVVPLVKPNSILLIGWGDAVVAVEELISQLDKPVSPESQSGVFHLKHASATQVQQTLQTFFTNRPGLGTRVQLAVDQRTNSLIAYAAPRDMQEIAKVINDIDQPEGQAVNRAQVFQIQHALAADVAETLQQAIQSATATGDRIASMELQTFDAQGQTILRSGTLQNVQITPNPRNNTLIVSSPVENLPLLAELIKQLDTPTGQAKIKVFRITNGDSAALIQTLRSLIPSEVAGSPGSQLSATGEAGLAPLRFSVDARSNSIIATGSEGDLRIVEALLAKLDQSNSLQRKTSVYRLKNSPAIDVAQAINQYLFSRRALDNAVPGQGNAFAEIEREVVVVPEPVANKLILAATPRYFDEIMELVKRLDESPPQVMIQVLIAEVALDNADEFGVELGLQDSILFDRSLLGDLLTTSVVSQNSTADGIVTTTQDIVQAATNIPGFNFNSSLPLGNSGSSNALTNAGTVGGQGISNFELGRTNEQLGFGGLVLSASSQNVSVLLRALRESRRVDVLSRPQIRTLDNQPAFIQVGQRVPRIVGSSANQFGQTNSVELENVGLILGVTPRISPDGKVVMEIDAEKSSLGTEQNGIPIAVSVDGTVVRSPRVDTTTAQATVSAADGETIVLGGLITKENTYVHRTVPILGEIPILEHLFRYDSNIDRRTELLIILTPHIIRTPEDNERIRQAEMARMSWCACDVYSLMDDVGYVPETAFDSSADTETEVIYPDDNPTGSVELLEPPQPYGGTGFQRTLQSEVPTQLQLPPPVDFDNPAIPSLNSGGR